jgi:hypothetical protein
LEFGVGLDAIVTDSDSMWPSKHSATKVRRVQHTNFFILFRKKIVRSKTGAQMTAALEYKAVDNAVIDINGMENHMFIGFLPGNHGEVEQKVWDLEICLTHSCHLRHSDIYNGRVDGQFSLNAQTPTSASNKQKWLRTADDDDEDKALRRRRGRIFNSKCCCCLKCYSLYAPKN